jgi:hypothetical protein
MKILHVISKVIYLKPHHLLHLVVIVYLYIIRSHHLLLYLSQCTNVKARTRVSLNSSISVTALYCLCIHPSSFTRPNCWLHPSFPHYSKVILHLQLMETLPFFFDDHCPTVEFQMLNQNKPWSKLPYTCVGK